MGKFHKELGDVRREANYGMQHCREWILTGNRVHQQTLPSASNVARMP
jgi:hypothetical protein